MCLRGRVCWKSTGAPVRIWWCLVGQSGGCVHLRERRADSGGTEALGARRGPRGCHSRAGHPGEVSEAGSEVAAALGGECRRCAAGRCIVYAGVCACVGVCLGGCHRAYVSVSSCLCHWQGQAGEGSWIETGGLEGTEIAAIIPSRTQPPSSQELRMWTQPRLRSSRGLGSWREIPSHAVTTRLASACPVSPAHPCGSEATMDLRAHSSSRNEGTSPARPCSPAPRRSSPASDSSIPGCRRS